MSAHESDEPSEIVVDDLDAPPPGAAEAWTLLREPDHAVLLVRLQRTACVILPLSFVLVVIVLGTAALPVMAVEMMVLTAFYLAPHFSHRTRSVIALTTPLVACLFLGAT